MPSHMYNMEISYNLFILAALAGLALSTPVHDNYHGYNRYSGYGSHSRRCSPPKYPYHGGYDGTDDYYSIGHKLTYYCDDGYDMYGSGYSTCKYSSRYNRGYWDPYAPPYCRPAKKLCPDLDAPENGDVQLTGRYPGDKATYTCDHGYVLDGSDTRICKKNGEWSGEAPECPPVDCGYPDPPDPNGERKGPDATTLGNTATYTCNHGYLPPDPVTIKCLYTGLWSGGAPVCYPVDCGDPDAPDENGSVKVGDTTLGNKATYKCNYGFILVGSSVVKCLYTGEWNDTAPVCKRISCPELSHPENGKVRASGYYPHDEAYYKCNYGYYLEGPKRRTCTYSGSWTGSDPKCVYYTHGRYPPYDGYKYSRG